MYQIKYKGLESIPILHCHGTADPVVRLEWGVKTKDGNNTLTKQR